MKISLTLTLAMLAALCFTNSAIGQAQTKDRAKLIEDAKKEGKVMVYVSSNASDARALEAAFEKKYPFVNMEFYSSGKDALLTRYMLEARTGANLADVYQSSVFPIMNLAEKGLLAKYYSPERDRRKISRVTFNAALKPLLSRFRDADEDRVSDLISGYLTAVRQQLSLRDIDTCMTNPTVFRALFELFPRAAQRVSDMHQDDYGSQNFSAVLEPVFSHLQLKTLTTPGTSYKNLGDKLVRRLDKSARF